MKRPRLLQVSVATSLEAEEAVVELLARVLQLRPAVYANEETKVATISAYCKGRTDWTPAKRAAIRKGLDELRDLGLAVQPGTLKTRTLAQEDWSESWKRHFKPIEIGSRLLVKPGWIKRRPCKGQAVVVLDPGLSFGTGNHPTTHFCLSELAATRRQGHQSFWDVGTGSGILAIAAAKLGYAPIRAVDFDPEAVRVARENARRNHVSKAVQINRQDITRIPLKGRERYDVICANLIADLLLAERKPIVNRLAKGGCLVLAGILKEEFVEVRRAYERLGLGLLRQYVDGEWCSGSFAFCRV